MRPKSVVSISNVSSKRVLPDSNIWLNAAFKHNSPAYKSLEKLRSRGAQIFLEQSVAEECLKVIERRRSVLGIAVDPSLLFRVYSMLVGANSVVAAPSSIVTSGINKQDAHVARAAIHYDAAIITGDAVLVSECQKAGIVATFPWSAFYEDGRPPWDEILRFDRLRGPRGTLFARASISYWDGKRDLGLQRLFSAENFGELALNTKLAEWQFIRDGKILLSVGHPPTSNNDQVIVCLSYSFGGAASEGGHLTLRSAHSLSEFNDSKTAHVSGFGPPSSNIRICDGSDVSWLLRHISIGSEKMKGETWRAICAVKDAAPDPMNENVLDRSLLIWSRVGVF